MAQTLAVEYDSSKFWLQSVNILLQVIGQIPVATEDELINILEAQIASSVLLETKKEVLSDEWDFNRDYDYEFAPDTDGYISIPANILDIYDSKGKLIMRDWRLYSKEKQTAIFTEAQTMNVVWDMDFNSITHPLRNYITIRAARRFQARQVMDTNVYSYTVQDEETAYQIARRSEAKTGKFNMLTSGTFGGTVGTR